MSVCEQFYRLWGKELREWTQPDWFGRAQIAEALAEPARKRSKVNYEQIYRVLRTGLALAEAPPKQYCVVVELTRCAARRAPPPLPQNAEQVGALISLYAPEPTPTVAALERVSALIAVAPTPPAKTAASDASETDFAALSELNAPPADEPLLHFGGERLELPLLMKRRKGACAARAAAVFTENNQDFCCAYSWGSQRVERAAMATVSSPRVYAGPQLRKRCARERRDRAALARRAGRAAAPERAVAAARDLRHRGTAAAAARLESQAVAARALRAAARRTYFWRRAFRRAQQRRGVPRGALALRRAAAGRRAARGPAGRAAARGAARAAAAAVPDHKIFSIAAEKRRFKLTPFNCDPNGLELMGAQTLVFCIDNSDYSRNCDYEPNRFYAQREIALRTAEAQEARNPENNCGIVAMAGAFPKVLISATQFVRETSQALYRITSEGQLHLADGLRCAYLALKNRPQQNQAQSILLFVCSPLQHESEEQLAKIGQLLRRNNIHLDIVSFGCIEENHRPLELLLAAAKDADRATLLEVPSGVDLVTAFSHSELGWSGPNELDENDPELMLALQLSLEEERARAARAQAQPPDVLAAPGAAADGGAPGVASESKKIADEFFASVLSAEDLQDAEVQRALQQLKADEPAEPAERKDA